MQRRTPVFTLEAPNERNKLQSCFIVNSRAQALHVLAPLGRAIPHAVPGTFPKFVRKLASIGCQEGNRMAIPHIGRQAVGLRPSQAKVLRSSK